MSFNRFTVVMRPNKNMANVGTYNSKIDFLKRTIADLTPDNPAYVLLQGQIADCENKVKAIFASHGLRKLTEEEIDASWQGVESDDDQ